MYGGAAAASTRLRCGHVVPLTAACRRPCLVLLRHLGPMPPTQAFMFPFAALSCLQQCASPAVSGDDSHEVQLLGAQLRSNAVLCCCIITIYPISNLQTRLLVYCACLQAPHPPVPRLQVRARPLLPGPLRPRPICRPALRRRRLRPAVRQPVRRRVRQPVRPRVPPWRRALPRWCGRSRPQPLPRPGRAGGAVRPAGPAS